MANFKTATKEADENYEECTFESDIITVNPPPITGMIKINNKLSNSTTDPIISQSPIHVTISVEDKLSGIKKIEYLKTEKDIPNNNS